jgi:hypothetical protein
MGSVQPIARVTSCFIIVIIHRIVMFFFDSIIFEVVFIVQFIGQFATPASHPLLNEVAP